MYRVLCALALSSALYATDVAAQGAAADFRQPGGLQDGSPQKRARLITAWVGFPYLYYGWGGVGFPFGFGASYFHPLVEQGFVPELNDSFNLEAGANIAFAYGGGFSSWLSLPVTVSWMLHFTRDFAGLVKLGAALNFGFGYWAGQRGWFNAFPVGGIGVMVRLSPSLMLRVEAGYPWLSVGLGFAL